MIDAEISEPAAASSRVRSVEAFGYPFRVSLPGTSSASRMWTIVNSVEELSTGIGSADDYIREGSLDDFKYTLLSVSAFRYFGDLKYRSSPEFLDSAPPSMRST